MVKIGKLPIVQHIINYYKSFGYNDFILATGYKKEVLEKYYKNKKNVRCIFTGKNTLTGGRILRLKRYFKKNENFLLTYGDGLINQNLNKLLKFHIKHKKIATLTSVKPPARFGEVKINGNRVSSFEEKPQLQNNWINGGFFVFNSKIFNFISGDKTMLEREPFQKLTKIKNLMAYKHYGFWQCMDTMRDKKILENFWRKSKTPWINQKK
jgi:glucose-1-phosphate cytidylyltransferase